MPANLPDEITRLRISILIPVLTLQNNTEVACVNQEIQLARISPREVQFTLQDKSTKQALEKLSWEDVDGELRKLGLASFYANYARIKEHLVFRKIYNRAQRKIAYAENGTVIDKMCWTFPCMNCGIILPEGNITVDHHHPQTGGMSLALLKVFRACGLTIDGPVNTLGEFYARHAQTWLSLASVMMTPDAWPTLQPATVDTPRTNKANRDTLNTRGTVIFSLLHWSQDLPYMQQMCMNSILNLKPLCLSCNSSKGNTVS